MRHSGNRRFTSYFVVQYTALVRKRARIGRRIGLDRGGKKPQLYNGPALWTSLLGILVLYLLRDGCVEYTN